MPAGSTYSTIATTTLGSTVNSYTFTGIPSTYTDLILVGRFATDNPSSLNLNVGNGSIDTGSNYGWTYLQGDGSTASSARGSNDGRIFSGESNTGSMQTNIIIQFQNYSNTTTFKTSISRFNQSTKATQATVGLWRSTSAINQVRITAAGNNLNSGSTFTLYGIASA